MSKDEFADNYEVGYGKPRKNSQFQKGISGNPTGRPKKARDLGARLLREANSLMPISENGRTMRISKHEVVIKMMINNAMKGKPSDLRMYFALYPQAFEKVALMAAQKMSDNAGLKDPKRLTDAELENHFGVSR